MNDYQKFLENKKQYSGNIGIELKESYFNQAVKNLESLEKTESEKDIQQELF